MVILCPGQGAQAVGMGKAWAEASPIARRVFDRADEVMGDRLGAPLSALCFEGPEDVLSRTDVAQPALYVCGVASFNALFAGDSDAPALGACAGLSLGEYTALHVAGAIAFEDGLELVALRGRAMQEAAEATPSSMVALVGADEGQAREVCERAAGGDVLVPANMNAPGQVVLSGSADACRRALEVAGETGLRATALNVAGAFHSPLMAPAAERLRAALEGVEIGEPACPVMSNASALPHGTGDGGAAIREGLVAQLTEPVRWSDCCVWLTEHADGAFHELAPGRVLAGLMRRIHRETKVVSHDLPD